MVRSATIDRAIISDGCQIENAKLERFLIGLRSVIRSGSSLKNVVMMGADYYAQDVAEGDEDLPPIGIGHDCHIENAIIDKNVRIGDKVVISPTGKSPDTDGQGFYIRDGLVVIPKNSVIPPGTWI